MSRAEQLAKFLEEGDSKVLAELTRSIASLEQAIDQKFEAFDEVIQSIGDTVDTIEEKMDKDEKEPEKDDDKEELAAIKAEVKKAVEAVLKIRIPEQKIVDLAPLQKDISMLKLGLANTIKNQSKIESDLKTLKKEMGQLLTAKRVPILDSYGNVIAVKLEI